VHPIARYRRARGLTQAQLAKQLGLNIYSVQKWEGLGAMPRPGRLPQLAAVLGVDALRLQDELEGWRRDGGA
jgi:transcriptional regulator with XRE-family HTH domain